MYDFFMHVFFIIFFLNFFCFDFYHYFKKKFFLIFFNKYFFFNICFYFFTYFFIIFFVLFFSNILKAKSLSCRRAYTPCNCKQSVRACILYNNNPLRTLNLKWTPTQRCICNLFVRLKAYLLVVVVGAQHDFE